MFFFFAVVQLQQQPPSISLELVQDEIQTHVTIEVQLQQKNQTLVVPLYLYD
jgi:hypothetical protein